MSTRILSVFSFLKRVGFAVLLLLGGIASAQDWETPILLVSDSTWWNGYPVLRVDASHNVHVFAVKQSDSLRDSAHVILPHELWYMKFTNWGVPIGERVKLYDPDFPFEFVQPPAVVLDRNSRFHVFWSVSNGDGHRELYYAMMDTSGGVLVGPDTLFNPANIGIWGGPAYAAQNLDGTIWVVSASAYACVSEDGVLCDTVRRLHETAEAIWPTIAIGPDTSAWACFRWGPESVVSMRRLDDPFNGLVQITQGMDQHGVFIDRFGFRHILTTDDSAYVLRISPDGLIRDSVAFSETYGTITKGSPLIEASGDSLLHSYRSFPANEEILVWFSLDNRILRGPEYHETTVPFGSSATGVVTTSTGGYWILGLSAMGESGSFLNRLAMLHVAGTGEPLSIDIESPPGYLSRSSSEILAFPSPTSSHVSFRLPQGIGQVKDIRIYNILGQTVGVISPMMRQSQILEYNLDQSLPTGMYFVSFIGAVQTYTIKIIKQ